MSVRTTSVAVEADASVAEVALSVIELLAQHPGEAWYLAELAAATGHRLVDVAMTVARLTVAGAISHDGIGSGYWVDPPGE